jgi:hypothetical protein
MKMLRMETDREKSSLMKDLHDVGLKHGLTFVVVARPIDGKPYEQEGLLIDHKDETPPEDVYLRWIQAGVWLIQATSAIEDWILEQRDKEPAPVKSP